MCLKFTYMVGKHNTCLQAGIQLRQHSVLNMLNFEDENIVQNSSEVELIFSTSATQPSEDIEMSEEFLEDEDELVFDK